MNNWEYFKVGYKEKPKAMGIVVRVDGKSKLEVFSGEDGALKEFGVNYASGNLNYDADKYFVEKISESTAKRHKSGRQEWKMLQYFTRGASPAGIYSAIPNNIRSKIGGF